MRTALSAAGLCLTVLAAGCGGCGEPPERADGGSGRDAGAHDALGLPDGGADAGVADGGGADSGAPDTGAADTAQPDSSATDGAVTDGAVTDSAVTDSAVADSAPGVDAGAVVPVSVEIKVDELGTTQVADVRFNFVRLDWRAFQAPVACADGGYADAGPDAGSWSPFADYATEVVGETAVLNGVGRTAQSFTVDLPERPPASQLSAPPDDPCNLDGDLQIAYYLPIAYLEGSGGTANTLDEQDDIVGMGEIVRYASNSADGQPFLVFVEGSDIPIGESGWNYLVLGLGDGAPAPEVRDLAVDAFPVAITVTPRDALDVSGELKQPDDTPVTPAATRRVGLVVLRTLGGLDEIVSAPATGTTYTLAMPAGLGGGDLSDYLFEYGPLSLARGMLYAYLDDDSSGSLSMNDTGEGSSDQSCPIREVWFFTRPLPWPLVIYTRARIGRGYNVLGMGWDADSAQVSPFINIPSRNAPIDIDIPPDPDRAFTDNAEPTADRGCACGVIPAPYQEGCQ